MQIQSTGGFQFSIAGQPVYPHIKLTREDFPRALATRILKDDGDEYFGAFLNRTSVRILIDFLSRTFRLRSCTIAIDGRFPVPCTQYYAKRCVAPCVASLCDRKQYLEIVDLARLFLRNERGLFREAISKKIERAAATLDFETAAFFRDVLKKVEVYWSNARWQVWLDDTVDTFELKEEDGLIAVIIISQRRSRALGEIVFTFAARRDVPAEKALADVIAQFYQHHLPREIRVSHDFQDRTTLAKELGKKFGRKIQIVVTGTIRRVTTGRALEKATDRLKLEAIRSRSDVDEIKDDLVRAFGLREHPSRIEAFDVAHISATGFAAAVSVWQDGTERPDAYEHWLSDRTSELDTLREFVAKRIRRTAPDLILVDGGRSHLNAALDVLFGEKEPRSAVIAAVKPRGKHSSISHFLTADGQKIVFDQDRESFGMLKRLRDEAHDLANATHRLSRDMMHFYELAAILPSLNERERQQLLREFGSIKKIAQLTPGQLESRLGKRKTPRVVSDIAKFRSGRPVKPRPFLVPIRFVETDGAAEDLIPIETR